LFSSFYLLMYIFDEVIEEEEEKNGKQNPWACQSRGK
jgi:hypothetical protein